MKLKWGKEKIYRNKNWLEDKYVGEKLTIARIGELCDLSYTVIWKWLNRLKIPIRSRGEAQHLSRGNNCNLSIEAIHWLYGELLGDGCLEACSPYSARVHYASKYKEYAQYVSDKLKFFGIKRSGKIYKQYIKKDNCYIYSYNSLSYAELLTIRKKWYPDGKKIVPRDIVLTPLVCRQWYIGDGCLTHPKNARPSIILSTDCFLQKDVNWLIKQLINLGFKATRQKSNNRLRISSYSTKYFIDYIGRCPVECYKYKWDYNKKGGKV